MLAHQIENTPQTLSTADYLKQIHLARLTLVDDTDATIALLKSLMKSNPRLPDACLLLAETYETSKPEEALALCTEVLKLCPEHIKTLRKRAKLYGNAGHKKEALADLANAKAVSDKQMEFTVCYHEKLREYLRSNEDLSNLPLLIPDIAALNYKDANLTNGASEDAFLSAKCSERVDFELTMYFAEKAIGKFENDVISANTLAYTLHFAGNNDLSLEKLAALTQKYNYPTGYFYMANIYRRTQQHTLARENIIKFLQKANRSDLLQRVTERNLQEFLYIINKGTLENEGQTALPVFLEKTNLDKEIEAIEDLCRIGNIDAETCEKTIKHIQQLVLSVPDPKLYYMLSFLLQQKDDMPAASEALSLSILLESDDSNLGRTYSIRSSVNLILGEALLANNDLEHAINALRKSKSHDCEARIKTLTDEFAGQCLSEGRSQFANKNYTIAMNIFDAGISRQPCCELYVEFAQALAANGKYAMARQVLLTEATTYYSFLPNDKSGYKVALGRKINSLASTYSDQSYKLVKSQAKLIKLSLQQAAGDEPESKPEPQKPQMPEKKKKKKQKPAAKKTVLKNNSSSHQFINAVLGAEEAAEKEALNQQKILEKAARKQAEEEEAAAMALFQKQEAEEKAVAEKKKQQDAKSRTEKRTTKNKIRKQLKQQLKRKAKSSNPASEENVEPQSPPPKIFSSPSPSFFAPNIESFDLPGIPQITVPLLDIENKILEKLSAGPGKRHEFRIVGGGAAYRIQAALTGRSMDTVLKEIDDIDIATDMPPAEIRKIFPNAKFNLLPGTEGVFSLIVDGIKVDITYTDDLHRYHMNCDFFCVWLNKKGIAFDPLAGKQFEDLRNGILPCARKNISSLFKEDPIRILRAIYTSNKGHFKIPEKILDQITIDKGLLVPGDKLAPERLNFWIRKILSKGNSCTNYESLREFGLLEILFPNVCQGLKKEYDWILEQIIQSKKYLSQSLEFVYASLIVAGLAPEIDMNRPLFALQASIRNRCKVLIAQSKLFSASAIPKEGAELDGFFQNVIENWKNFHAPKPEEAETLDRPNTLNR